MKDWLYLLGLCGAVIIFAVGLLLLGSHRPEAGDHNTNKIIEFPTTSGEKIKLSCPEYEGHPLGAHGRECYLVKEK